MSEMFKNLVLWLIIGLLLMAVFSNFGPKYGQPTKLAYSHFVEKVNNKEIKQITVDSQTIEGVTNTGEAFFTDLPAKPELSLLNEWINKYDLLVRARPPEQQSMLLHIFISWFPVILFIGVWIFFMRQMQGGGGRSAMSFGRSRARLMGEDQVKVTFADVAGVDEAKSEVAELVDFLKDPGKFYKLGGKIPRGVLMIGPPGTGKTLLAKAIAGEARVPFFTISGSDFVEMFVGVGASRVRDMFEQAKKCAPCIIFIDEIDAVGRHRGAGLGGGHDEREQTLNQLLVEMDGFDANNGVIVIAATNRPDVLDPALLRPGRFDRRVVVNLPDLCGREQILNVHLLKIVFQPGTINVKAIARGTPGFSGADLANLVNEAALLAARANSNFVTMVHFELAKDKIIMGVERRSLAMSEKERTLTAYHESGHAIVGLSMPGQDPVYKVTIIPRELALGVTFFLPENDAYSITRQQLEGKVASAFGGRVAEELIFGNEQVTTGASNDIKKATEICRNMVTKWGLSEKLGPLSYRDDEGEVFLGHSIAKHKEVSESTAQIIDQEVRMIIDKGYTNAKKILEANLDKLHIMARSLLKYETLDAEQVKEIMEGKEPKPPAGWSELEQKNDKDNKNNDDKLKNHCRPPIIECEDPKNANLGSA